MEVLRSSEFYVGLLTILGYFGASAGWWSKADYDHILYPALTYIVARVISKMAKAAIPAAAPKLSVLPTPTEGK